jgi:DNA invertase Pin-like site-specific DNA recombinase
MAVETASLATTEKRMTSDRLSAACATRWASVLVLPGPARDHQWRRGRSLPTPGVTAPLRGIQRVEIARGEWPRIDDEHAKRQGWSVVETYCDAGESASSMQRPQLQKLLARCQDGTRTVDAVLVHSISRGFRNLFDQERTVLELAAHGVIIRSLTENLGDPQTGELIRLMLGMANQFKSHDARIGTMRGMSATARLGYSNGGVTPFGYRSVEADTIGRTTKRKLIIDPVEADIVRLVFQLAIAGPAPPVPWASATSLGISTQPAIAPATAENSIRAPSTRC